MDYSHDQQQNKIAVRLDKGDSVIDSFHQIAEENDITSGQIIGIGAVKKPVIGYYQTDNQAYKKDQLTGSYELTNLTAVITEKEEGVHIHAHATLAGENHQAFGGHLHKATIAAAGEFWIYASEIPIKRQRDNPLGLDLMRFSH